MGEHRPAEEPPPTGAGMRLRLPRTAQQSLEVMLPPMLEHVLSVIPQSIHRATLTLHVGHRTGIVDCLYRGSGLRRRYPAFCEEGLARARIRGLNCSAFWRIRRPLIRRRIGPGNIDNCQIIWLRLLSEYQLS